MKERLAQWLQDRARLRGVLAAGIRFADKTASCQSFASGYPVSGLENAWRCVADTYQVLNLHRVPGTQLKWSYEGAALHCTRRKDGVILAFFTAAQDSQADLAGVQRLMDEFVSLDDAKA
jgi:hypothetical protein